jgi:tRNA 2-thiouridine synthesizing protein B
MLFTVNKSSLTSNSLDSVLRIAPKGSPILFYEDGVYIAMSGSKTAATVNSALGDHQFYALDADLEARGIEKVVEGIKIISYDGFVELVEKNEVVPWL